MKGWTIAALGKLFSLLLVISVGLAGCGSDGKSYETEEYDGYSLLTDQVALNPTEFNPGDNVEVFAAGLRDDPAVIAAAGELIGGTTEDAVNLLKSYDPNEVIYVGEVTGGVKVDIIRYWGSMSQGIYTGQDRYGRWLGVIDQEEVYAPNEARSLFALPNSNSAMNASWYRLKKGAKVIYGRCADMTWNPDVFGPYATGGAFQIYSPNFTKWNADLQQAELNPAVAELVSDVRQVMLDE